MQGKDATPSKCLCCLFVFNNKCMNTLQIRNQSLKSISDKLIKWLVKAVGNWLIFLITKFIVHTRKVALQWKRLKSVPLVLHFCGTKDKLCLPSLWFRQRLSQLIESLAILKAACSEYSFALVQMDNVYERYDSTFHGTFWEAVVFQPLGITENSVLWILFIFMHLWLLRNLSMKVEMGSERKQSVTSCDIEINFKRKNSGNGWHLFSREKNHC